MTCLDFARALRGSPAELARQHTWAFLVFSYAVVPPVGRKLFQALHCSAVAGKSYLVLDTSVDCESAEFKAFKVRAYNPEWWRAFSVVF
jgi:hypothetical protein